MANFLVLAFLMTTGAVSAWALYQILASPLRKFPGPKLWAVTQFPWHQYNMAGTLARKLAELHETYGPAVRVGPNEISFIAQGAETWKTIYQHRPIEMVKFLGGTGLHPPYNGVAGIEASNSQNHPRIRKAMSPAFSERALRDQEGFLRIYTDKLLAILSQSKPREFGRAYDFAKLFNLTAFDITADLSVGKSFGGLDKQTYHPWVQDIYNGVKAIAFVQFTLYYRLTGIMGLITPVHLKKAYDSFYATAFKLIDQRIDQGDDDRRKDFISYMYSEREGSTLMSRDETRTSFTTLLVAGSESSASNMAAIVYLTLAHPPVYKKLVEEIRSHYKSRLDVTIKTMFQLEYFTCVMQEAFRIFPPAPATIPRIVPEPGESIDGFWVAGGSVVGINQWSTYHSPINFYDPESFVPERWLPKGERPNQFDDDHRTALQPFSYGNRDCIGQKLAHIEVRAILFSLLAEFDLELENTSENWTDQLQFLSWEKKPLMVKVRHHGGSTPRHT